MPIDTPTGQPAAPLPRAIPTLARRKIDDIKPQFEAAETPEAALTLLDKQQALALKAPSKESDAWLRSLVNLYEQMPFRAKGTPAEGPALLALSRAYQLSGNQWEWLEAFQNYADFLGDAARQEQLVEDAPPAEAQAAAQRAKAAAYFDEAKRLYESKDASASVALCDRLLAKYPSSAKAYEGQVIAARCYVDLRQPEAAVECYRRIVKQCPDELFAREAAKATIRLLSDWRKTDEAIAESRQARVRFNDDGFRLYALTREAELLKGKGQKHYPEAVKALREIVQIQPDSLYAKQAENWIRAMNRQVATDVMGDIFK